MPVETYKAKKILILDPEHYGFKKPCIGHYLEAQKPFMNSFFKERYGLSIEDKEQEREIIDKWLLRYSEDKDEEGLTASDRYKLVYAEKFLSGKFRIEDGRWAEKIKKEAGEIKKHLEKAEGRGHKKEGILERILHEKAAAILFAFSVGLFVLSVSSRVSTTGYSVSEGFSAGNYYLAFALLFFIAGIIVFILAGRKKKTLKELRACLFPYLIKKLSVIFIILA